MDAYIFQAKLLCEGCGKKAMEGLPKHEDSDHYPQGPYGDGGGEADTPQHCGHCDAFLENPLTSEGYEYVKEQARTSDGPCVEKWCEFYSIDIDDFEREKAKKLYASNYCEIDDDATVSRGEDGSWVQAWVFVGK